MAGARDPRDLPKHGDLAGKRLVVVSLMPCTAKKSEAQDLSDVDYVLTTRELEHLWGRFGVELARFTEQAPLDAPFAEATGAGRLFAGSGGVTEAAGGRRTRPGRRRGTRGRPQGGQGPRRRRRAPLHGHGG